MTSRRIPRKAALLILALVLVPAAAFGRDSEKSDSAAASPVVTVEQARPGSPAVYRQIEQSRDCDWLQATFDRADRSHGPGRPWATEYMAAADERMRLIGCYE